MSFYERGDDRGFQNSQRMENLWAVEIIALRLRPTRSFFDGSALSSLPADNGQLLSLFLIQCYRRISGWISRQRPIFDARAKVSTEIVAQY
jgi:hypothetical protein